MGVNRDYTAGELLEAFGFQPIHDGHWYFCQEVDGHRGVFKAIVVVERNRDGTYSGHVPLPNDLVTTAGRRGIPDRSYVFTGDLIDDIVALAQSEIAKCQQLATGRPPEEGFMDVHRCGATFIAAPFMNNPWNDYGLGLGAKRTDKHIRLESPGAAYGRAYHDWRSDFCERVIASRSDPDTTDAVHPSAKNFVRH